MTERKGVLLRLDPAVHNALTRWAADELRSTNAHIEFLLRRALGEAGKLPRHVSRLRPRGRPPATADPTTPADRTTPADPTIPADPTTPADPSHPPDELP